MQRGKKQPKLWMKLKQRFQNSRRVLLSSVGVTGFVIALRLTGVLQAWEWTTLDLFFRSRPTEPIDERIIIVGIDESNLQKIGRWPIPDSVMAQLLQRLQSYQPRVVGLDIYRDLPVEPGHSELLRVYQQMPNLIGIQQLKDKNSLGIPAPLALKIRQQVGFNNLVNDQDSKVRRGLLYWSGDNDTYYESFALKLSLAYLKPEGITPQSAKDGSEDLQLGKAVFPRFQANDGGYVQADDGGYQILANLRGPARTFKHVSMMDVLEGRTDPKLFRDRIVLIGSTAVSLKDFFYTSYSGELIGTPQPISGVELQAQLTSQIISSALQGRSSFRVWAEPWEWLWILVWTWVGASTSWKLQSPRRSVLVILLAGISLFTVCYLEFLVGWWIPLIPPMIGLGGAAIVMIAHIAHLQDELKRSKEFLNKIINAIPDPIFVKDRHHRWVVLNQAFCRFLGYSVEEILEKSDYDVFAQHEANTFRHHDQLVFNSGQEQEQEEKFTDRNGTTHQIATKRTLHKDSAGNEFLVGVIRDITERKRMEEDLKRTAAELVRSNEELQQSAHRLHHMAMHDTLTGLPNRKMFYERLDQALSWAAQNERMVAVLFLDLDGFKQINDSLGHDFGDLLLKAIAKRLTSCLRGSDTVSRLGGDEFTVILPAIPSLEDAGRVAEKILDTLSQQFTIDDQTILVTISIGISLYPNDGEEAESLIKGADVAMYRAKELGKSRYEFFDKPDLPEG